MTQLETKVPKKEMDHMEIHTISFKYFRTVLTGGLVAAGHIHRAVLTHNKVTRQEPKF